jgi:hypothetical protein
MITSGDGGRTWSAPLRVSSGSVSSAWRPALAINGQGRVAVSYFAASPDEPARGETLPVRVHVAEVRLQSDGTLVLGEDTMVDRYDWIPLPRIAYFLGDYNPLLATRGGIVPMYARPGREGPGLWCSTRCSNQTARPPFTQGSSR